MRNPTEVDMKARTVLFILGALVSTVAMAQNNRSFVSTTGSDVNNCTAGNECRSFTRAMAVTNPGGQILAIASGGYGPFSIMNQSVTVAGAEGVTAAITVTSGGLGVLVNGTGVENIALRNLDFFVGGTSNTAIYAGGFKSVAIENCRLTGGGIEIVGDAASAAMISDTVVRDAAFNAFLLQSPGVLVRCHALDAAGYGLSVYDGVQGDGQVSAVDFVATGCTYGVVVGCTQSGHHVTTTLDRALISSSFTDGIDSYAVSGSTTNVRVSNSVVVDNGQYGFHQETFSTFSSMHNNLVVGNGSADVSGSLAPITVY